MRDSGSEKERELETHHSFRLPCPYIGWPRKKKRGKRERRRSRRRKKQVHTERAFHKSRQMQQFHLLGPSLSWFLRHDRCVDVSLLDENRVWVLRSVCNNTMNKQWHFYLKNDWRLLAGWETHRRCVLRFRPYIFCSPPESTTTTESNQLPTRIAKSIHISFSSFFLIVFFSSVRLLSFNPSVNQMMKRKMFQIDLSSAVTSWTIIINTWPTKPTWRPYHWFFCHMCDASLFRFFRVIWRPASMIRRVTSTAPTRRRHFFSFETFTTLWSLCNIPPCTTIGK